jgi:hypothetical protein
MLGVSQLINILILKYKILQTSVLLDLILVSWQAYKSIIAMYPPFFLRNYSTYNNDESFQQFLFHALIQIVSTVGVLTHNPLRVFYLNH